MSCKQYNNKTHKHLPRFFYNDELNDDGNFQHSFPLQHSDRNQYLIREDLMNIYKTDVTEEMGVINDHLLLCDYIVGALKWRSKEYVRYRLTQRKYNRQRGFGFSAKSTEFYLNVFDYYFAK